MVNGSVFFSKIFFGSFSSVESSSNLSNAKKERERVFVFFFLIVSFAYSSLDFYDGELLFFFKTDYDTRRRGRDFLFISLRDRDFFKF